MPPTTLMDFVVQQSALPIGNSIRDHIENPADSSTSVEINVDMITLYMNLFNPSVEIEVSNDKIIAYSYIPVIEEILIKRLTEYLMSDCKWADQFPNFPQIRINNEYPWVPYLTAEEYSSNGWLDLNKVSETLFPAITIITNQDLKSPQVFVSMDKTTLEKSELAEFQQQAESNGYLISPEAMNNIINHFSTKDALYGTNVVYQRRDTINIDIITDDKTNIKNRLYDLINLFLVGHGNISLSQDMGINIIENSISGNRSGVYNMDFGRELRQASIQVEIDYKIFQVFYDPSANLIGDILINP